MAEQKFLPLSERLLPNVECTPWDIEELKALEARLDVLSSQTVPMTSAAQEAKGTIYTLIVYRPDGVDMCRNCVMGSSPSHFELHVFKNRDELVTAWTKAAVEAPDGREYSETEFWLLIDGLSSDQDYIDDAVCRERDQIQTLVSAETQRLEAIKLEAAHVAEKAEKRAEEDRREAAERKQLAALQQKYGAK